MKRAFVVALVALWPLAAHAQSDPAAATELFKQAREAAARGEWKTACPKFAESLQLDAKVGTAINLADCEEKLGQLASARGHVQRAIDLARAANDDRLSMAQERFAALDKRVPRLTITLVSNAPPGAVVKRDGISLGAGSLGSALPVDPGTHVVVVQAAGCADKSFDVKLAETESKTLDVSPGERQPDAPPTALPMPLPIETRGEEKPHASPLRTLGFALGGAGVASLATGVIAGLIAIERNGASKNDCTPPSYLECSQTGKDTRDAALTAGNIATVAFIAGGVLVAGGVTLVLVAPKPAKPSAAHVEAIPSLGGFLVHGAW